MSSWANDSYGGIVLKHGEITIYLWNHKKSRENGAPGGGRCADFDGEINAKIEMVLLSDFIFGPLAVSMLFVCFLVEVLVLTRALRDSE